MHEEEINYQADGQIFKSFLATEDQSKKRPAILVIPYWRGLDELAIETAKKLALHGYVGVAIDYYGNGKIAKTDEEAAELMTPLFMNREVLQKRLIAAFNAVKAHPSVDGLQIAAMGFCFGGLCAIELLRSGVPLKGSVAFHAVLNNRIGDEEARTVPIARSIQGSLLILNGHDDPLVSLEDILAIQKEMTEAKVDWQMHLFSHTSHAFTNPHAQDKGKGLMFNQKSNDRAWIMADHFYREIFKD